MTPDELAALHHAAFATERPWSANEFAALLKTAHVSSTTCLHGFALVRAVAGEAELLTLAVHPGHRRMGKADWLMASWMATAPAETAFLEVAADNLPALGLYRKHGFAESGRRKGYYRRADGTSADAVLMTAALPRGQSAESRRDP